MDLLEQITLLINSIGFPIFCSIVLFHQQKKLTEVIANISITLKSLDSRLERLEHERSKKIYE